MDEPVKDKMSGRSRALGQLMLGHNLDRERERDLPASLGWGGHGVDTWEGGCGGTRSLGKQTRKGPGRSVRGSGVPGGQGCRGIAQSCRNRDRGN